MDSLKTYTEACHRNVQEAKFFITAVAAGIIFSKEFYGIQWTDLYQNHDLKTAYAIILASALCFSIVLVLSFTLERAGYALMSPGYYGKFPKINEWLVNSKMLAVVVNTSLTLGVPLFIVGFALTFFASIKVP